MENADQEPVIIEDLVKFGEDRGLRRGKRVGFRAGFRAGFRMGFVLGTREAVRHVLAVRELPTTAEQQRRLDACKDIKTLRRWLAQAILAASAAEALR